MSGLPSHIAKKYGIGKKAWAVYRSGRSSIRKTIRRGEGMARRHYRRSGGSGFNIKGLMYGAAAGYIAQRVLGNNLLINAGAGYFAAGTSGAIGAIVGPMLLNGLGTSTSGGTW